MNNMDLSELNIFKELIDTPRNKFVEKAVAEGFVPIGYACYIVPSPLLSVGKLIPIRLRAPRVNYTDKATYYLSNTLCTFSRSVLEEMISNEYSFLKGIINGSSCMHITRATQHSEILEKYKEQIASGDFVFWSLDTPRVTSNAGKKLFVKDMKRAAAKLAEAFDIDFSDDELTKAIKKENEFRKLMRELSDFRKGDSPKITGTEFQTVMVATQVCPKEYLIEPLKELIAAIKKRPALEGYRARLMVVGSVFDNPEFSSIIESEGALISCDRYCFGSIPGIEEISEDGDPWMALASHYVDTCECGRMMGEFETRYENKKKYIKEYSVDGVVMQLMKFCDLWAVEVPMCMDRFKIDGIPAMKLEHEYTVSGEGQIRTRIQAFIEKIENQF